MCYFQLILINGDSHMSSKKIKLKIKSELSNENENKPKDKIDSTENLVEKEELEENNKSSAIQNEEEISKAKKMVESQKKNIKTQI